MNPIRLLVRSIKLRFAEKRRRDALLRLGVIVYYASPYVQFENKRAAKKALTQYKIVAKVDKKYHNATIEYIKSQKVV